MAPKYRVEKKWVVKQLQQHIASLETLSEVQSFQKTVMEMLGEETAAKPQFVTARNLSFDQVVEIFGLNSLLKPWELRKESYETPRFLTANLGLLQHALYDRRSEAYSRIAIDYMIVACIVKHRNLLSKQSTLPTDESGLPVNNPTTTSPILKQSEPLTNNSGLSANHPTAATSPILEQSELQTDNPHNQKATIVPVHDQATEVASLSYDTSTTLSKVPKSPVQPLPIKVFPEMTLSVQVKRGSREWHISGVADWAMGYGDRADLDDGTVLLAVKAKQQAFLFQAEAQLLAYLATIRQLRIQAHKKNVMAQGFYSDGENYRFLCIRNDGTVMKSLLYEVSVQRGHLKAVFNFLLSMLVTAAESSPNTSPAKPGTEQDKKIEHFDQEVFVKVFEDIGADNISVPSIYYEEVEEGDEMPDISYEQE